MDIIQPTAEFIERWGDEAGIAYREMIYGARDNDLRTDEILRKDGWIYSQRGERRRKWIELVHRRRVWKTRRLGPIAPVESLYHRLKLRSERFYREKFDPILKTICDLGETLYLYEIPQRGDGFRRFEKASVRYDNEFESYSYSTVSQDSVDTNEAKKSLEHALKVTGALGAIEHSLAKHRDLAKAFMRARQYNFDLGRRVGMAWSMFVDMATSRLLPDRYEHRRHSTEIVRIRVNGRSYAWSCNSRGEIEQVDVHDEVEMT